jgi:hypothetical protein
MIPPLETVSSHKSEKTARNNRMKDLCPKCGAPKSKDSCPKCGLVFAKYNATAVEPTPSSLKELWEYVENNWAEAAAHGVFIERAFFLEQPGFAARCYRLKGDDPTAKSRLAHIVCRMEQALLDSRTEPVRSQRTGRTVLLAVLFIVAASIGAFLVINRLR